MRKLLNGIFISTLFFYSNVIWAYSNYFCEKGARGVSVGDTIDTVRAACGDPTTVTTKNIQEASPASTVQWIYTLGFIVAKNVAVTLPTLTITFQNQVVTQLAKNGIPLVGDTNCTLTGVVRIGDSMDKVTAACGQPNMVNNSQQTVSINKEVMTWTYNFGPYQPQILFNFENGQLAQITSGQLGK